MADKSVTIIGAGMAGLSVGCYGQMNGYHSQIFEMDTRPGGLCTTWKRKGYKIDGCIEYWLDSGPGSGFYRMWKELGAVQGRSMIYQDEWGRVEGKKKNKVFILYTDINRLEQHMKELAPADEDVTKEFIQAVRISAQFKNLIPKKAPELFGLIDYLKMMFTMMPYSRLMKKWGKISIQDFAKRFKDPFLREAFPLTGFPPTLSMCALLTSLPLIQKKQAGFPLGGSQEIARVIERRYLALGGEIHYKSRVTGIIVKNNQAVGVRLADGTEHRSDVVISAADGRTTIFDMLDGKYINDKIRGYYDNLPTMPPLIYIGLGVARSFSEPHSVFGVNYPLDKSVTIAGRELNRLPVHIYNFDPSLAPAGKTVIRVKLNSDYEYWSKLREEPERYKAEKDKIAEEVIALLDERFPGLADQVEMRDVATPTTFERYTGNWRGSYMGWATITDTFGMRMSKTLPGLQNFYMAGQWVEPGGGTPAAVMSGRNVVQIISKQDNRPFVTMVSQT